MNQAPDLTVGARVRVTDQLPRKVNTAYVGMHGTVEIIDRWGVGVRLDESPAVIGWFIHDELGALETCDG